HGVLPRVGEMLRDDAHDHVRPAARREGHHDADLRRREIRCFGFYKRISQQKNDEKQNPHVHGTYTHRSSITTAPGTPSAGTSMAEKGRCCPGRRASQACQAAWKSARLVWNCCARTTLARDVPAFLQIFSALSNRKFICEKTAEPKKGWRGSVRTSSARAPSASTAIMPPRKSRSPA